MADLSFKIKYGNNILVYPGWSGYLKVSPTVYIDFLPLEGQTHLPSIPYGVYYKASPYAKWSWYGNYARLTVKCYEFTGSGGLGLFRLFSSDNDTTAFTRQNFGAWQIVSISGDVGYIQTIDRAFNGCTAIVGGFYNALSPWINGNNFNVTNVNQAFSNIPDLDSTDTVSLYNLLSTKQTINSHSDTFKNSGDASDLAQIPVSWGGTYTPQSTQITLTRQTNWAWEVTDLQDLDFERLIKVQIWTDGSMSQYAGISMNRSRLNKVNNSFSTSAYPLKFYPAFFQCYGSLSYTNLKYLLISEQPNGSLNSSASTDMPGTLSYETYGYHKGVNKVGTFDPYDNVYFGFYVMNLNMNSPSLTDGAFLWNNSYLSSPSMYYVDDTLELEEPDDDPEIPGSGVG